MRRRDWVGLGIVMLELAAAAGCGVDSYLTCGAACDDAGSTVDATIPDTGTTDAATDTSSVKDAASDATKDSNTSDGNCAGNFCNNNQCCSGAPICNAGNRCATSCGAVDASCTQQNGDTCCKQSFCNSGHCAQRLGKDAGCVDDFQCCSNNCSGISNTCQ